MDPISAFMAAQAAIAGIRKCVDLYKEAKSVAADVTDITLEIGGHIGSFLDAHEVVKKAAADAHKIPPPKGKSLASQALDNVLRARELARAETELREMLVYQTPGLGGLWTEFEVERERLFELQRAEEKRAEIELKRIAAKRQQTINRLIDMGTWCAICAIWVGEFSLLMWWVVLERIKRWGF